MVELVEYYKYSKNFYKIIGMEVYFINNNVDDWTRTNTKIHSIRTGTKISYEEFLLEVI